MKDSTKGEEIPTLLMNLMQLLEAHRPAFKQARPYWRAVGLVLAELFSFGRHTVAQSILSLGQTREDWSGWYRLFSRERFEEEELNRILFRETLGEVGPTEPYVVGIDGTQLHRSSLKMPGTSWLKAARTAAFRPGIERAQRFLTGAWLTPLENGYSRAIPLRFIPAFPPKAVPANDPPRREWEAGLLYLQWVRVELDQLVQKSQKNDSGFLTIRHLSRYRNGKDVTGKKGWEGLELLMQMGEKEQFTIVDLRPMRKMIKSGELKADDKISWELNSYDLLLIPPDDLKAQLNY